MTDARRTAKRWKRENRPDKGGTWRCGRCNGRHANGKACPMPKTDPFSFGMMGMEAGVIAALAAAKGRSR